MTPMTAAIIQNTPGYSEAYPAGVPRTFSWCAGTQKYAGNDAPPRDFKAVTGWGQVYPQAGASSPAGQGAAIEIANARTYVRLKETGAWVLVQRQSNARIAGAHFVADFSGNRAVPMTIDNRPNGSAEIGYPPVGYNSHFWVAGRGTFEAGSVDGVYVQLDMRTTDPESKPVANIGADWWRDPTASYAAGFSNNPGAGVSNWVKITTHWSTLYFYSVKSSELRTNPPPPLAGSTLDLDERPPPRSPSPSPCRPVAHQDLRTAAGLDPPRPAPSRRVATRDRETPSIIRPEPSRRRRR